MATDVIRTAATVAVASCVRDRRIDRQARGDRVGVATIRPMATSSFGIDVLAERLAHPASTRNTCTTRSKNHVALGYCYGSNDQALRYYAGLSPVTSFIRKKRWRHSEPFY
ncbi:MULTISPECIES: hypothetical protein [Mycetohabitans]|uniref:hypothetical protein n=1 Tax=Mycetohabitans TaxID=2571159 RepID=UPI0032477BBA|nr:hypothetical protein [Mycetohabitans sp. B3]